MRKAWKIAPGEHADVWEMCRERRCIVIGWRRLGDYRRFRSEAAIAKVLKQKYKGSETGKGPRAARSVWRFTHDLQPKDVVIANDGRGSVVGIGVIGSEYLPAQSPVNPSQSEWFPNARLVDWLIAKPVRLRKYFFVQDTVWPLEPVQCEEVKRAYLKKYPELKKSLGRLFDGISSHEDVDDSNTKKLLAATEQQLVEEEAFDPTAIRDARERILSSIVRRRGQPAFRKLLLAAYNGRCAITGCDVEAILESAHIVPYRGSKTNHAGNGLLLRADLHTLFDLRLVAVQVQAPVMTLLVSPKLAGTEYEKYHGKPIRVPEDPAWQPSQKALEQHRRKAALPPEEEKGKRKKGISPISVA